MNERPDDMDLELIALDLITSRLERGDEIFVFSSSKLRGKLITARFLQDALPSQTYLPATRTYLPATWHNLQEPCVVLTYTPTPKDDTKKPTFKRVIQTFTIPVRILSSAVHLQKLDDAQWMLNIDTSVKK